MSCRINWQSGRTGTTSRCFTLVSGAAMFPFKRTSSICLLVLAVWFYTRADAQCTTGPDDGKLLLLDASSGTPASPKSFNYTVRNDTDILVRLTNINPYAFKCSVSTNSTPFKET